MRKSSFLRNLFRGMGNMFIWNFHRPSYEECFGTDAEQLAADWKKVGDDIQRAIKQFEKDTLTK